ncbi:MAG: hypothetical protein HOU81_08470 [Hamadaea sp.]|uniref:CbrC family protein n=1 Tax=Hamadaea sp. TaxID=2024425 RepID=UPI00182D379B|nr:CbrC family protein [Hamadaea sp.]NUR70842.1 hypothetical protein [Hamadaea sp.]NUT20903.1 hypothetical protein [Hamadaea sp.]
MPTEPEITFALYTADLSTAAGFAGAGSCAVCAQQAAKCFRLEVGTAVIHTCNGCGSPTAISSDAHSLAEASCPRCSRTLAAHPLSEDQLVCTSCLSAGRAAFTKDTEFGMVRWEDAVAGRTHGVPGLSSAGGLATVPAEDGWTSVLVDPEVLLELVRTPTYITWQGEQWLFCCQRPMTFIGEWSQQELAQHSDGDLASTFLVVFDDAQPWVLEYMPASPTVNTDWGFYAFRCRHCDRVRGHFDMS